MKKTLLVSFAALFILGSSAAHAQGPFTTYLSSDTFDSTPDSVSTPSMSGTPSNGIPDIRDAINLLLGTSYASNADVDSLQYTDNDNVWQVNNPNSGFALIGLSAGNFNTLNVYDISTPSTYLDVFGGAFSGSGFTGDGSIASPFIGAQSPLVPGTLFGFNLSTAGETNDSWDSDPSRNSDGIDHLLSYSLPGLQGKTIYIENPVSNVVSQYTFENPYLVAWEDLPLTQDGINSDHDYNDMMYVVDRVVPVPEPMSVALLAVGLVGMGVVASRRNSLSNLVGMLSNG